MIRICGPTEFKSGDIPTNPGVYLYRSEAGEILYIGKAKDLKKRVASYFIDSKQNKFERGGKLLALVPLHNVWVTANFKENQLKNMRKGQKVIVSVDAYGGRKYEGHIDSIAAATGAKFSLLPPENATGNFVKVVQRVPVKIVIDKGEDEAHPLRPGLSVAATVYTREDELKGTTK